MPARTLKTMAAMCCVAALIACAEEPAKLDASSQAAFVASIEKVRAPLPEADKKKFNDALQKLMFSQVTLQEMRAGVMAGGDMEELLLNKMRTAANGMTAAQVLAKSK